MDVRLVTDGVERPVEELPELLGDEGLVWVDIPSCDEEAAAFCRRCSASIRWRSRTASSATACPRCTPMRTTCSSSCTRPSGAQRGHVHYIELDQFVGRNYW